MHILLVIFLVFFANYRPTEKSNITLPQIAGEKTTSAPIVSQSDESITPAEILISRPTPTVMPTATTKQTYNLAPTQTPINNGGYTCDCSKTCTRITSCTEAQYLLNVCNCNKRDADGDGIACDSAPLNCQN